MPSSTNTTPRFPTLCLEWPTLTGSGRNSTRKTMFANKRGLLNSFNEWLKNQSLKINKLVLLLVLLCTFSTTITIRCEGLCDFHSHSRILAQRIWILSFRLPMKRGLINDITMTSPLPQTWRTLSMAVVVIRISASLVLLLGPPSLPLSPSIPSPAPPPPRGWAPDSGRRGGKHWDQPRLWETLGYVGHNIMTLSHFNKVFEWSYVVDFLWKILEEGRFLNFFSKISHKCTIHCTNMHVHCTLYVLICRRSLRRGLPTISRSGSGRRQGEMKESNRWVGWEVGVVEWRVTTPTLAEGEVYDHTTLLDSFSSRIEH